MPVQHMTDVYPTYDKDLIKIMTQAMTLCRSHTNWKIGKGSVNSFSNQKTKFWNLVENALYKRSIRSYHFAKELQNIEKK